MLLVGYCYQFKYSNIFNVLLKMCIVHFMLHVLYMKYKCSLFLLAQYIYYSSDDDVMFV